MRIYHTPQVADWLREAFVVFVILAALLSLLVLMIPSNQ